MNQPSLETVQMQAWARRIREGDRAAPDELLRAAGARLEALARKMLRGYPAVRRYEDTCDLFQNAMLRLVRALREVEPASVRDFFGLAAEQMRRELLDMVRRHYGPNRHGAHQIGGNGQLEVVDEAADPAELDRWAAFHEAVAMLPADEREVVGLIYYHGWKYADVAELFQVSERTISRRWESALVRLRALRDGAAS